MNAHDAYMKWLPDTLIPSHEEAFEAGWKACAAFYDDKRTIVPGVKHVPATTWTLGVQAHSNHVITAEDIYNAYPRKVGKQAAIKAIEKACGYTPITGPKAQSRLGVLLERTQAFARAVAKWPAADRQFVPHPASFFNAGRYDDDEREWFRGTPTTQQIRSQN